MIQKIVERNQLEMRREYSDWTLPGNIIGLRGGPPHDGLVCTPICSLPWPIIPGPST